MPRFFPLPIFLLACFSAHAQTWLAPVKKPMLFGLEDSTGKTILAPQYSMLLPQDGKAWLAKTPQGYGVIEASGNWIVKPSFAEIAQYREGRIVAGKKIKREGKTPRYYEGASDSVVRYGIADAAGNWITEPGWSTLSLGPDGSAVASSDGVTYGYLDKDGRELIAPQYGFASYFIDERAVVSSGGSRHSSVFDYYLPQNMDDRRNDYYGGQWEVIDKKGTKITKEQYDYVRDFSEGRAAFNRGGIWKRRDYSMQDMPTLIAGRWGFLDKNGNEIIAAQYDYVYDFKNGVAKVRQGERTFYIDIEGKEVPAPVNAPAKNKDFAWPRVSCSPGYYGYIDVKGAWALPPAYLFAQAFSEGLAAVQPVKTAYDCSVNAPEWYKALYDTTTITGGEEEERPRLFRRFRRRAYLPGGGWTINVPVTDTAAAERTLYGYIDKSGKMIIAAQYDEALPFSEGRAYVRIGPRWGVIDKTGRWIMAPVLESPINYISSEHYRYEEKYETLQNKGMPLGYRYSEGMGLIRKYEKYGFADPNGKIVIAPVYDYAEPFSNGLAVVQRGDKWGYIDKTGKIVIPLKFTAANSFREGIALVRSSVPQAASSEEGYTQYEESRYGYIDAKGKWLIPPAYTSAEDFSEGLAAVSKDWNRFGYIDKGGNFVIAPKYHYAASFVNGHAAVKTYEGEEEKLVYIDRKGKVKKEFTLQNPPQGDAPLFPRKNAGEEFYGFRNAKGEWIVPPQFEQAEEFSKAD